MSRERDRNGPMGPWEHEIACLHEEREMDGMLLPDEPLIGRWGWGEKRLALAKPHGLPPHVHKRKPS